MIGKHVLELPIEFVPMPVTFRNHAGRINTVRQRTGPQVRGISSEAHRTADGVDAEEIAQLIDHGVRRIRIEFRTVRAFQVAHIEGVFDHGTLHPKTNAKIWDLLLTSKLDGSNHSRNTTLAKTSGNQD